MAKRLGSRDGCLVCLILTDFSPVAFSSFYISLSSSVNYSKNNCLIISYCHEDKRDINPYETVRTFLGTK